MKNPLHGGMVDVRTLVIHVLVLLVIIVWSKMLSSDGCQIEFDVEQPSSTEHVLVCLFWHLLHCFGSPAIANVSSRLPVHLLVCPFQFWLAALCTRQPNLSIEGPLFHN
jgi:hypothetical protein